MFFFFNSIEPSDVLKEINIEIPINEDNAAVYQGAVVIIL